VEEDKGRKESQESSNSAILENLEKEIEHSESPNKPKADDLVYVSDGKGNYENIPFVQGSGNWDEPDADTPKDAGELPKLLEGARRVFDKETPEGWVLREKRFYRECTEYTPQLEGENRPFLKEVQEKLKGIEKKKDHHCDMYLEELRMLLNSSNGTKTGQLKKLRLIILQVTEWMRIVETFGTCAENR